MKKRNIYEIYEGDELVCKGGCDVVSKFLGIVPRSLSASARHGTLVNKKYRIVVIRQEPIGRTPKPKTEKDELDYLYRHLAEFGNTCSGKNPNEYIPKLEEMLNEKIGVTQRWDVDDPWNYEAILSKPGKFKQGRRKPYYILEIL